MRTISDVGKFNPPSDWETSFTRRVYSPLSQYRQQDGWSCGLFVIAAMNTLARNLPFDRVQHRNIEYVRCDIFKVLKELPYVYFSFM